MPKEITFSDRKRVLVVHGAVLVFQIAALMAITGWETLHGFPLDDAWIHQVVARTFAQTGTLGYAPGHFGAGATSYFWASLLALNYKLVHADPGVYTFLLNALFFIGAGQCLAVLMERARPQEVSAAAWSVVTVAVAGAASLGGNFVWFAVSGMEAPLTAFLPLASIVFWTGRSRRSAIAGGVFAGLLALTRPEAIVFAPLCVLWMRKLHRSRGDAIAFLAPWAAALALYIGSNVIATGHMLPATLSGRRWLWLGEFGGAARRLKFLLDLGIRLEKFTLSSSILVEMIMATTLAALGAWRMLRSKSTGLALMLAWTCAHVGIFLVLMPTLGHGGRYQPLVPLVFIACATFGAITFAQDLTALVFKRPGARAAAACAVLGMVPFFISGVMSLDDWRDYQLKSVTHIRATETALGPLVDQLPADARVASYDIGGVGFSAHRPIFDLGGLTDYHTGGMLLERRAWEVLRDWQASHVIVPAWYRDDLPAPPSFLYRLGLLDNPAIELEEVRELGTPFEQWTPSIISTWNASPRQVLYEIHYTGKPGPRLASRAAPAPAVDDPEGLLTWQGSATVRQSLTELAGNDVRIALSISSHQKPAATPHADDTWSVRFGAWGFELAPPAKLTLPDAARAGFAELVQPYVEVRDWDGAALASTHAVARIFRQQADPTFLPFLPVLQPAPFDIVSRSSDFPFEIFTIPLVLLPSLAVWWRSRKRGALGVRLPVQAAAMFGVMLAVLASCSRDLAQAVDDGNSVLEQRLAQGADPNAAVAHAVARGRTDALWLLLSHGANPNRTDPDGRTPLHLAARTGQPGPLRMLLAAGADPNAADPWGETPLHLAARSNRAEAIRLLLDAHANPAARDARGFSPLDVAAELDAAQAVDVLVAHGAALDAKTPQGETAADIALRARADRTAQLLIDAGAAAAHDSPLLQAARTDDVGRAVTALGVSRSAERRQQALAAAQKAGSAHVAQLLAWFK